MQTWSSSESIFTVNLFGLTLISEIVRFWKLICLIRQFNFTGSRQAEASNYFTTLKWHSCNRTNYCKLFPPNSIRLSVDATKNKCLRYYYQIKSNSISKDIKVYVRKIAIIIIENCQLSCCKDSKTASQQAEVEWLSSSSSTRVLGTVVVFGLMEWSQPLS